MGLWPVSAGAQAVSLGGAQVIGSLRTAQDGEPRGIIHAGGVLVLTDRYVVAFIQEGSRLERRAASELPALVQGLRLVGLVGGDFVVASERNGRVQSFRGRGQGEKIVLEPEAQPYFYNRVDWQEESLLVGQRFLPPHFFAGPVFVMDASSLESKAELPLVKGGLSGQSLGLYGLASTDLDGDKLPELITLGEAGVLKILRLENGQWKKFWFSAERYGGPGLVVDWRAKDILLGGASSEEFIVPQNVRILQHGGRPLILVPKNDTYLREVIGPRPVVKSSQFVLLGLSELGIGEVWQSAKLDGAIVDYTLADWDGDGVREILALVAMREGGYLEAMHPQTAKIVVFELPSK